MPRVRAFRPGDEPELASVCLRTAASGEDATGMLEDDELWAHLFVLPYVEHDPESAFVVEADDGRVAGYVVAAADTDAYSAWFRDSWWPRFHERWPEPAAEVTRQDELLRFAYQVGAQRSILFDTYPAHLHIDLLPELQKQGFGRRLIEALKHALHEAGVTGLHVVPLADNTGAVSFYERLGFEELERDARVVVFGVSL